MDKSSNQSQVLTVQEAATTLGVSRKTIYRMIQDKKLGAARISHDYRIPKSEIDRLLNVTKDKG